MVLISCNKVAFLGTSPCKGADKTCFIAAIEVLNPVNNFYVITVVQVKILVSKSKKSKYNNNFYFVFGCSWFNATKILHAPPGV